MHIWNLQEKSHANQKVRLPEVERTGGKIVLNIMIAEFAKTYQLHPQENAPIAQHFAWNFRVQGDPDSIHRSSGGSGFSCWDHCSNHLPSQLSWARARNDTLRRNKIKQTKMVPFPTQL